MRTDFIRECVAALRSGEYPQGTGALCSRTWVGPEANQTDAYCCLGVFCEVGIKHGLIERNGGEYLAIGEAVGPEPGLWNSMTLPDGFWQWIGFERSDPQPGGEGPSLSSFNDEMDMDFHEIADIIEKAYLTPAVVS